MSASIWRGAVVESGRLEDYSLAIAIAMALAFDAVLANWPLLAALDSSFATRQASGLCALPGEFGLERRLCGRRIWVHLKSLSHMPDGQLVFGRQCCS